MSGFKEERLMQVLLAPQISEKATYIADKNEQVIFRVASDATKPEVKVAVELLFKVEVKAVQGVERQGKQKRFWQDDGASQGLEEGLCVPQAGPRNQLWCRGVTRCTVKVADFGRSPRCWRWSSPAFTRAPRWPLWPRSSPRPPSRNNNGHITTRHKGGGHKHYRVVDFRRNKDGIVAKVERIEYDPNRSANIALLCYADGFNVRYIIALEGAGGLVRPPLASCV